MHFYQKCIVQRWNWKVLSICKRPFLLVNFEVQKYLSDQKVFFDEISFSDLLISVFSEFENFSTVMRSFSGFFILASIHLIFPSIFMTSFCKYTMSFFWACLWRLLASLCRVRLLFGKVVDLVLFLRFVTEGLVFLDDEVLHFLLRVFSHIVYECWKIVFIADSAKSS